MSVLISPDSAEAKELAKWEMRPTPAVPNPLQWGFGGKAGMPFQEFPKMVSKAERNEKGKIVIVAERTVGDEAEEALARGQGYFEGHDRAIAACKAGEFEVAELAAERGAVERTMSDAAQREAAAADEAAGVRHLASVPETPIKPRKRTE